MFDQADRQAEAGQLARSSAIGPRRTRQQRAMRGRLANKSSRLPASQPLSSSNKAAPSAFEQPVLSSRPCESPVSSDSLASSEADTESRGSLMSDAVAIQPGDDTHRALKHEDPLAGHAPRCENGDVVMRDDPGPGIVKAELRAQGDLTIQDVTRDLRGRELPGESRVCSKPSPAFDNVRKMSRSPQAQLLDTEQAHSPQSSIHSRGKRSASCSPSRSIGRGSSLKPKYEQSRGVNALSKRRGYTRNASGLRSAALLSKANHFRTNSSHTLQSGLHTVTTANSPDKNTAYRQDSGYVSRQNTQNLSWNPDVRAPAYANVSPNHIEAYGYGVAKHQDLPALQPPRYDMILQPKSSPLTQGQLGAEVKGIYAGLVMVEAKCINMDHAKANDTAEVSTEEWQTLIALHRTLLYEHHDFLMATQHPSANVALRGLASKYCMPARMWKHGIHSFLEVLRHRRPHSQEYMLCFIYLAYQMMCLLFDTIPSYMDTWIECLGDLARYRMAIEEDKEIHAVWCAVAARWYQMAADRHPQIGRLYHHLGILERPSLRKFYFYARSLTSVVPFLNAAESLGTLCAPILQDDTALRCGNHSAEAMTICFHARVFTSQTKDVSQYLDVIAQDGETAHELISKQPSAKICSYGVALAVTNIAGLFQYGLQENIFRTMYSEALAREAHNARPSVQDPDEASEAVKAIDASGAEQTTAPLEAVIKFWAACLNSLVDNELNQAMLRDLMQNVHVNLVFISSLINLRSRLTNEDHVKVINDLFDKVSWAKLATFLNAISQIDPITQRVEEHAIHNIFLMPDLPTERRPLVEDYMLRGIVWAEEYPSPELFYGIEDDDGSRTIDTPARLHLRAERVLWLACLIAQPSKGSGLHYDRSTQRFSASQQVPRSTVSVGQRTKPRSVHGSTFQDSMMLLNEQIVKHNVKTDEMSSLSPRSMDVVQPSPKSSIADGFDMVSIPPEVRSLSSMDGSRSTPMKSVRSTTVVKGSPERAQLSTRGKITSSDVRIEGEGEVI